MWQVWQSFGINNLQTSKIELQPALYLCNILITKECHTSFLEVWQFVTLWAVGLFKLLIINNKYQNKGVQTDIDQRLTEQQCGLQPDWVIYFWNCALVYVPQSRLVWSSHSVWIRDIVSSNLTSETKLATSTHGVNAWLLIRNELGSIPRLPAKYVVDPVLPISQFKAVGIVKDKGKPNFLGVPRRHAPLAQW